MIQSDIDAWNSEKFCHVFTVCRDTEPARMAECCRFLLLLIAAFVDISVATLTICVRGWYVNEMHIDTSSYGFATSTLDFWFCAIVRSAILGGAVIGVLCNKTEGQQRLMYTWPASMIITILMMMFAVVKMLAYTEVNRPSALFWCQFAWMLTASVVFHAAFVSLRRSRNVVSTVVNASINAENGEQQPLFSGHAADDASSTKTPKKKMSVVFRLLSYSKPDAHLVAIAFAFMVISSVCKYYSFIYSLFI